MFKVKLKRGTGFTQAQWDKEVEASYWWARCVNDSAFQDSVLNFAWSKTVTTGALFWKKKKTLSETGFRSTSGVRVPGTTVVAALLAGAEILTPDPDGEAYVELIAEYKKGVVGWTNPKTHKQWVNPRILDTSSIAAVAANRAHEFSHKLGFSHEYKRTTLREFTVPYAVGKLVGNWVAKNYVAGEWLAGTPLYVTVLK